MTYTGTEGWMAPEVIKGTRSKYGHPADVFSYGLIAMFLMTNNLPLDRGFTGKANIFC